MNTNIQIKEAIIAKDAETVKTLVDVANIDAQDKYGDTLLHLAVLHDLLEVVKYLLEKGADCNTQNKDGRTPLQLAEEYGRSSVVIPLLLAQKEIEQVDLNRILAAFPLTDNLRAKLWEAVPRIKEFEEQTNRDSKKLINHPWPEEDSGGPINFAKNKY